MKDFAYYSKVGISYPAREDYTKVYVYSKGVTLVDGMNLQAMPKSDIALHEKEGHIIEKAFDKEAFDAARKAYYDAENVLHQEFKKDLFEFHGVTDNPKAETLFARCWDRNHSGGYSDVASIFSDFVEVIQ